MFELEFTARSAYDQWSLKLVFLITVNCRCASRFAA